MDVCGGWAGPSDEAWPGRKTLVPKLHVFLQSQTCITGDRIKRVGRKQEKESAGYSRFHVCAGWIVLRCHVMFGGALTKRNWVHWFPILHVLLRGGNQQKNACAITLMIILNIYTVHLFWILKSECGSIDGTIAALKIISNHRFILIVLILIHYQFSTNSSFTGTAKSTNRR